MLTTCPMEKEVMETLVNQLKQAAGYFTKGNQVYQQIEQFFNDEAQTQLPDMTIQQLEDLLTILENPQGKVRQQFKQMLLKLKPMIEQAPSSEFQINGKKVRRMCCKRFNTLLQNAKGSKTIFTDAFMNELDKEDFNISIDQLRMLVGCYKSNSENRKKLQAKLDFLKQNVDEKKESQITDDQFFQNLNKNLNVTQINQTYAHKINKDLLIKHLQANPINLDHQQIIDRMFTILYKCKQQQQNIGVLNEDVLFAVNNIIPKIIFKSMQILINYKDHKDFKVVNCFAYFLSIPICYLSEREAQPIIFKGIKPDYHLDVYKDQTNKDLLIHHINGNEYDNRPNNLVAIEITEEEKEYLGSDYTPFRKHQNLHMIFNTEYNVMFFENCINLQHFDDNNSFYKCFIKNNLNDPKKMVYEMQNVGEKKFNNNIDKIINYLKNSLTSQTN